MASAYREIAEFYDHEYADLDILGPDVNFLLDRLPDDNPQKVLELGCGTGRVARQLAAAGHGVTGLDVDPRLLEIAEAKGGVERYVEADVSVPDWHLKLGDEPKFDVVCCLFNTFLAVAKADAQEHCLRGVRDLLGPDGFLWLDVFHPNLDLVQQAVGGVDELEPDLFHLPDGRSILRTTSLYADLTRQVQHVTFTYAWFDEQGERQEQHRSFDMAWIMPREMDRLLRLCGFRVTDTFGGYDGSAVDDDSERQIIRAVLA